jgi:hypothetical protein
VHIRRTPSLRLLVFLDLLDTGLASEATFDGLKNVPCCFRGSIFGGMEPMVSTRGVSWLSTSSDTADSDMTGTTQDMGCVVGSVTVIGADFGGA